MKYHEPRKMIPVATFKQMKSSIQEDFKKLREERDNAKREAHYYKRCVEEKDLIIQKLEKECERSKRELIFIQDKCNALQQRTKLTETSQKTVKQQADMYEEAIQSLEKEIEELKSNEGPENIEVEDIHKRAVVLGAQLRKSEASKRIYEVAVNKLMKFVEKTQNMLSKEEKKNQNEPRKLRKITELHKESKQIIQTINALLEEDSLPYGWEEVFSPDGTKYYINHVTQITSWSHPVSGVQHSQKPP